MIKGIKILQIEAMEQQILLELNFVGKIVVGAAHSTNLYLFTAEYLNNPNWS